MKIYDISQTIEENMPVYPGDPEVRMEEIYTVKRDGFSVRSLFLGTHTGTHVDAPAHFLEKGMGVDGIDLWRLIGEAVVVERFGGELPHGAKKVLAKEGGLSIEEAVSLVDRGVHLIGTTKESIESDPNYEVHRMLLERGVLLLENLQLDAVAPGRYQLIALPLKLKDADGAPLRAVLIDDSSWNL